MKVDLIPIFMEAFTALAEASTSNFSNKTAVPDDTLWSTTLEVSLVMTFIMLFMTATTCTGHCGFD
jgi:hypothetical protein